MVINCLNSNRNTNSDKEAVIIWWTPKGAHLTIIDIGSSINPRHMSQVLEGAL